MDNVLSYFQVFQLNKPLVENISINISQNFAKKFVHNLTGKVSQMQNRLSLHDTGWFK